MDDRKHIDNLSTNCMRICTSCTLHLYIYIEYQQASHKCMCALRNGLISQDQLIFFLSIFHFCFFFLNWHRNNSSSNQVKTKQQQKFHSSLYYSHIYLISFCMLCLILVLLLLSLIFSLKYGTNLIIIIIQQINVKWQCVLLYLLLYATSLRHRATTAVKLSIWIASKEEEEKRQHIRNGIKLCGTSNLRIFFSF